MARYLKIPLALLLIVGGPVLVGTIAEGACAEKSAAGSQPGDHQKGASIDHTPVGTPGASLTQYSYGSEDGRHGYYGAKVDGPVSGFVEGEGRQSDDPAQQDDGNFRGSVDGTPANFNLGSDGTCVAGMEIAFADPPQIPGDPGTGDRSCAKRSAAGSQPGDHQKGASIDHTPVGTPGASLTQYSYGSEDGRHGYYGAKVDGPVSGFVEGEGRQSDDPAQQDDGNFRGSVDGTPANFNLGSDGTCVAGETVRFPIRTPEAG